MQKIHDMAETFEKALEELKNATLPPLSYPYNGNLDNIPIDYIFENAIEENNKGKNFLEIFENTCSQSEDINLYTFVAGMCFFNVKINKI